MSQSNTTQASSRDRSCEKIIQLVVQKEKAEQHLVELENKAHTLEKNEKSQ